MSASSTADQLEEALDRLEQLLARDAAGREGAGRCVPPRDLKAARDRVAALRRKAEERRR